MKKVLLFIMLICTMFYANIAYAENELIDGLEENMETLWLKNYFTQEQMDDMVEQQQQAFINEFYALTWPQAQTVWGVNGLNQEETLAYHLILQRLHPKNGIRVYLTRTDFKYAKQYLQNNQIDYLISDDYYWILPQTRDGVYKRFTKDGKYERIAGVSSILISVLPTECVEFLKDYNNINFMLAQEGIESVDNVKIISPDYGLVFLYVTTDKGTFLIKLNGNNGASFILPNIEPYKVYSISDIIDFIETVDGHNKIVAQGLQRDVLTEKEVYQEEAESLQAEGLLKGTEKGLDLLKPLTRVEAATMLLRAMGEPEITDATAMTFSDVSTEHWGYGAVENAYRLGLVNGVGDGKFAPEENVTAPQFATMILRAADTEEFNWEQAVDIMIEQGILTKEETTTMDFFTRGDMAKMIYEARENNLF